MEPFQGQKNAKRSLKWRNYKICSWWYLVFHRITGFIFENLWLLKGLDALLKTTNCTFNPDADMTHVSSRNSSQKPRFVKAQLMKTHRDKSVSCPSEWEKHESGYSDTSHTKTCNNCWPNTSSRSSNLDNRVKPPEALKSHLSLAHTHQSNASHLDSLQQSRRGHAKPHSLAPEAAGQIS